MRIHLTRDIHEIRQILHDARKSNDWDTHERYCVFRPGDTTVRYERALVDWKSHRRSEAFALLDEVIQSPDCDASLKSRALRKKAEWLLRTELGVPGMVKAAEIAAESGNTRAHSLFARLHAKLYNLREGDRAAHAVNAIRGFMHGPSLPEAQQLASMLFRSGKYPSVFEAVHHELESFPSALWLEILPQIFAQLASDYQTIRDFVDSLIRQLLKDHHHAVIFPLIRAVRIQLVGERPEEILAEFENLKPEIARAANRFYDGFLRARTTRSEEWTTALSFGLEFLKRNDADSLHDALDDLIAEIDEQDSENAMEFNYRYGRDVGKIVQLLDVFYHVPTRKSMEILFEKCNELHQKLKLENEGTQRLNLLTMAPDLDQFHDVDIAVPGRYVVGSPVVTMKGVSHTVIVFASKQRPKQIGIFGSDGNEYSYLLKNREDLRLDQRAMQFFALINTLIRERIVTYFVMPLTLSAGLIQWIKGSDTIAQLVRDYRTSRGIHPTLEARRMSSLTIQSYDLLRPIQRLEGLCAVAQATSDIVLSDILWLKSISPQAWLARTSIFSKTSALMSVVGYILGLGDRHPSNLMIQRETGTVIHIDFGDCFETTRNRLVFPELIPFRLTRFMIRALGPSGVNGLFKTTCCEVMKVMRRRRDMVMAVMEIFAYSPVSFQGLQRDIFEEEEHAALIIQRVSEKLYGNDFDGLTKLNHQGQVAMLIKSATDSYNFAHLYHGWNPLW
jgi:FKBP12-rapamycin complex-associated protein